MPTISTLRDYLNELSIVLQLSLHDNDDIAIDRFAALLSLSYANPVLLGEIIRFLNMSIANLDVIRAHDVHETIDRMFIGAENRPVPLHAYLDDKSSILSKLAYLETEILRIQSELSTMKGN